MKEILLILDVAHPPRHPELVEAELLEAWHTARNRSDLRVIKIIHGHGSSGRGGSTRDIARNWLHRNRNRFRAIIDGEQYSLTDQVTMELRREVGLYADNDLDRGNRGITLVWVR
jgi:hypothetical protein